MSLVFSTITLTRLRFEISTNYEGVVVKGVYADQKFQFLAPFQFVQLLSKNQTALIFQDTKKTIFLGAAGYLLPFFNAKFYTRYSVNDHGRITKAITDYLNRA